MTNCIYDCYTLLDALFIYCYNNVTNGETQCQLPWRINHTVLFCCFCILK